MLAKTGHSTLKREAKFILVVQRNTKKTDATRLIGNLIDQTGINVAAAGAKVNQDGKITIGEQTQGATAVNVSNGDANTVINFGASSVIDILGNISGVPKRNVGIEAENSDDAQITHGGTINVLGTNAVGENLGFLVVSCGI